MNRPHVVLLGAGASKQAFPNGDRNGRRIPLMNELVETTNIYRVLRHARIDYEGRNFEELYDELYHDTKSARVIDDINHALIVYFSSLEMPESPTLYDHLVLSLSSKDLIATFNWDPFLCAAFYRNRRQPDLPKAVYLHGNVAIGYCSEHRKKSANGSHCSSCGEPLKPSPLLYPVRDKKYTDHEFTRGEWITLHRFLDKAFILTIFGYSAPTTDAAAIELLSEAWGSPNTRWLEEIEIIDIQPRERLRESWAPFIHTHHFRVASGFYDAILASFPTWSCEAIWKEVAEAEFLEYGNRIPVEADHSGLWEWRNSVMRCS